MGWDGMGGRTVLTICASCICWAVIPPAMPPPSGIPPTPGKFIFACDDEGMENVVSAGNFSIATPDLELFWWPDRRASADPRNSASGLAPERPVFGLFLVGVHLRLYIRRTSMNIGIKLTPIFQLNFDKFFLDLIQASGPVIQGLEEFAS